MGTKQGGLKARDTNLAKDPDFYKKIGAKGGSRKMSYPKWKFWKVGAKPKGFAAMTYEKRSAAGRLGGSRSRRAKN